MNRLDSVEESRQRLTEIEAIIAQNMQVKFVCNFLFCRFDLIFTVEFCEVALPCIFVTVSHILISAWCHISHYQMYVCTVF